jgi:proton-translocating NAD(P)+ transhydrogenase subunit alpha
MATASGPGLMGLITVFVLAAFVGYEVISKVPSVLHTPLMSGTNAIHGIIIVGAMLVLGEAHGAAQVTLGFLAVVLATLNVVGGFVVTDRMLEMFKAKPAERKESTPAEAARGESSTGATGATGTTGATGATGTTDDPGAA